MPQYKYEYSLCMIENYIYIIGGNYYGNEPSKTCHRLDIKTGAWDEICSLRRERFAALALPSLDQ